MRSPFTITTFASIPILTKIWQGLTSLIASPILGQQRSRVRLNNNDFTFLGREYDLEITEYPIRDPVKARHLIEMWEYCAEIATAINEICDSCWSSDDGDDQGFTIAPTLNDNTTPIDPEIEKILKRLIDEVIGGITLEPAIERMLIYGDAFCSISVSTKKMQIERILFLPTWEMFRLELNKGQLIGFEQRRFLQDESAIQFHPLTVVHWRYRRKTLYGRSLFWESSQDWENLKSATEDLAFASRAIGVNPNIHVMPGEVTENYRKAYKTGYEARKKLGAVTDFYLMYGADIRKVSATNPDLKALIDNVLMWRGRIVMRSRVPPWLMGMPTVGAREIAGQPALAYARFINKIRMNMTQGIKQMCDLELALAGIPKEKWQYRIVWPRIYVDPYAMQLNPQADESNLAGIEDLEA